MGADLAMLYRYGAPSAAERAQRKLSSLIGACRLIRVRMEQIGGETESLAKVLTVAIEQAEEREKTIP